MNHPITRRARDRRDSGSHFRARCCHQRSRLCSAKGVESRLSRNCEFPPMAVSVFDLFKIGIGPSSSHTVGPMRAAARFMTRWLDERGLLQNTVRVRAELFGSLALTGRGHGTDKAVLCGLEGEWPDRIDPDVIPEKLERIRSEKRIRLLGKHEIDFDEKKDLVFNKRQKLPYHSNGMRFSASSWPTATITRWVAVSWSITMKPPTTASSPTPRRWPIPIPAAMNCSRAARNQVSPSPA